jgi:hypothetical protein
MQCPGILQERVVDAHTALPVRHAYMCSVYLTVRIHGAKKGTNTSPPLHVGRGDRDVESALPVIFTQYVPS